MGGVAPAVWSSIIVQSSSQSQSSVITLPVTISQIKRDKQCAMYKVVMYSIRALQPTLSRVSTLASNSYTLAATTHCRNKITENFDTEADRSGLVQSKELQQKYSIKVKTVSGVYCSWTSQFPD